MLPRDEDKLEISSLDSVLLEQMEAGQSSFPPFLAKLLALLMKDAHLLEEPELVEILSRNHEGKGLRDSLLHWLDSLAVEDSTQLLLELQTLRIQRTMGDQYLDSPLLLQLEDLAQVGLQNGWSEGLNSVFCHLSSRIQEERLCYSSFRIEEREWTIESFVGDYLLESGAEILLASLEELVTALKGQDERAAETALDSAGEAFLYLSTVKEWSQNPWM